MCHSIDCLYVTVFWKTDHLRTRTEIHVLSAHDRHTRALSRNTKYWTIDSQVCFYRRLFIDAVKRRGCMHFMALGRALGCINRTAWGTRLLLLLVLASFVHCNSLCHRLKVQHCSLSLNGCFGPPSASHPPTPSAHTPSLYKLNPLYYRGWKKTLQGLEKNI